MEWQRQSTIPTVMDDDVCSSDGKSVKERHLSKRDKADVPLRSVDRKLLLVTRNFPPLWGGMEKLNWHLAEGLAGMAEVRVIAPQGASDFSSKALITAEVPPSPLWRFFLGAAASGFRQAWGFRPGVVLAGSGLTAPLAWTMARIVDAKAVVYVHGLDVVASHPIYRIFWRPFLKRMDHVIANSRATAELAADAGVAQERISIVFPGVSIPESPGVNCLEEIRRKFRTRRGLDEGPLLLSVGRLTKRKGILEFVRDVLPMIVEKSPDVHFAIVGDVPKQSLDSNVQTKEQILTEARKNSLEDRIHFLGVIHDQEELGAAYCSADVHVFPVRARKNDPEGFGMVAIEAAAYGLPTVAYASGGVVDAVKSGVSGKLVANENPASFAEEVVQLLEHPLPRAPMLEYAKGFSWDCFSSAISKVVEGWI